MGAHSRKLSPSLSKDKLANQRLRHVIGLLECNVCNEVDHIIEIGDGGVIMVGGHDHNKRACSPKILDEGTQPSAFSAPIRVVAVRYQKFMNSIQNDQERGESRRPAGNID